MAVTFRAKGESPGADSTSCVIVKPTGLTEGDLMIAQILGSPNAGPATYPTLSGWTSIRQDDFGENLSTSLFWKIADGDDVAASDFTFTVTGTDSNLGAISAWYEHDPSSPINANNGDSAVGNPITSPEITPSVANCMILFFAGLKNNWAIGEYAIAEDNPGSWTERYDVSKDLAQDLEISMASALRPETTATGLGTATASTAAWNTGQLVAIAPLITAAYWEGRIALGRIIKKTPSAAEVLDRSNQERHLFGV